MTEFLPNIMMSTSLAMLIYVAGVYRISSILVAENSPFNIIGAIRDRVGGYIEKGEPHPYETDEDGDPVIADHTPSGLGNTLAGIWGCIWCMSVWVAGIAVVLFVIGSSSNIHLYWFINGIMTIFAVSAGAVGISLFFGWLRG